MPITDQNTGDAIFSAVSNNEPKRGKNSELLGANILIGEIISTSIDLNGKAPTHIHLPTGFSGTAITFTSSPFGTTYRAVYDHDNNALAMATVAEGRCYELPPELAGLRYLKVVSNVSQVASITLYVQAC